MSDSEDPKDSPSSRRATTSTKSSKTSDVSSVGNPLEQPIARPTTGGALAKDFELGLILRLQQMEVPMRLAKIVPFGEDMEVQVLGFLRGDWLMQGQKRTLKAIRFFALPSGLHVPNWEVFEGIGLLGSLPLDLIRGFGWANDDHEAAFFRSIGRYRKPS